MVINCNANVLWLRKTIFHTCITHVALNYKTMFFSEQISQAYTLPKAHPIVYNLHHAIQLTSCSLLYEMRYWDIGKDSHWLHIFLQRSLWLLVSHNNALLSNTFEFRFQYCQSRSIPTHIPLIVKMFTLNWNCH